jgi:hypothetical protein
MYEKKEAGREGSGQCKTQIPPSRTYQEAVSIGEHMQEGSCTIPATLDVCWNRESRRLGRLMLLSCPSVPQGMGLVSCCER